MVKYKKHTNKMIEESKKFFEVKHNKECLEAHKTRLKSLEKCSTWQEGDDLEMTLYYIKGLREQIKRLEKREDGLNG